MKKKKVNYQRAFIEKAKKCNINNLENNIKLICLLEQKKVNYQRAEANKFAKGTMRQIDQLIIRAKQISFDLSYPSDSVKINQVVKHHDYFHEAVIHQLYKMGKERNEWNTMLTLITITLNRGADINVIDASGNTLLHNLCLDYNEKLWRILQNRPNLDTNIRNGANKLALEIALEKNNEPLIEFLQDKTNYSKDLLIAATCAGNSQYIENLINKNQIDVNIRGRDGAPLVHYAIFDRYKNNSYDDIMEPKPKNIENSEQYTNVIKLLLKSGAEVSCFNGRHPLTWSLEKDDVMLSILLVENTVDLDYYLISGTENHPIHLSILNVNNEQRDKYLELIKKIAQKSSKEMIDLELIHGGNTPLYIAARQKDVEVMKILIDNGADINYKVGRFHPINFSEEIVKFFVDNGMRGACSHLEDYKNMFNLYKDGKIEMLKQLVTENSLNFNALDSDGKNLFWYAIEKKDKNIIYWLLDQRSPALSLDTSYTDSKIKNGAFCNYYEHLSKFADGNILQILQEKAIINWDKFNCDYIESICCNAFENNDLKAIKLLEQHKYFVILKNSQTGEIKDYYQSYLTIFKHIEKKLNNKELENKIRELKNKSILLDGQSLLHVAVKNNNLYVVEFLLGQEVEQFDKNILNYNKITALDLAVEKNCELSIIKTLIDKKVKIGNLFPIDKYLTLNNEVDDSKQKYNILLKYIQDNIDFKNVFFKAAHALYFLEKPHFVKLLLELDWNPNKYEKCLFDGGQTALHKCAYNGYDDSIKVLCESKNLDLDLPIENFVIFCTSGTLTAVGYALENSKFNTAKLLIEYGASPYKYLSVLLLDALYKQDIDYANLLLEKSILSNPEETKTYLNKWLGKTFTAEMRDQAIEFYKNNKDRIKIMPSFLYDSLVSAALHMAGC